MFTCVIDVSNATRDEKRELIYVANALCETFFHQTDMHMRINNDQTKTYCFTYDVIDIEHIEIDTFNDDDENCELYTSSIAFDDIRKIELILY